MDHDALKMAQDGAIIVPGILILVQNCAWLDQNGARWGQEGVKMEQNGVKLAQDGAKMGHNGAKVVPGWTKRAQRCPQKGGQGVSRWIMMPSRWPKVVL